MLDNCACRLPQRNELRNVSNWPEKQILRNLLPEHLIVLDNALCHSVVTVEPPRI